MHKKNVGGGIVLLILVAGISFYGGMVYGKKTARSGLQNFQRIGQGGGNRTFQFGGPGGNRMGGNGYVNGEIISKNDATITVKLQDGGSKILIYSPSTSVRSFSEVPTSQLEVGKFVSANGTQNSDGTVVAQVIQLRDASSTPFGSR